MKILLAQASKGKIKLFFKTETKELVVIDYRGHEHLEINFSYANVISTLIKHKLL